MKQKYHWGYQWGEDDLFATIEEAEKGIAEYLADNLTEAGLGYVGADGEDDAYVLEIIVKLIRQT